MGLLKILFMILLVVSVPIYASEEVVTVTVTSSPKVIVLDGINSTLVYDVINQYNLSGVKKITFQKI